MKILALLSAALLSLTAASQGAVIYNMDFSNDGEGSTHDTVADPIEASPITGANWILSYPIPASDTSTNEFITVGGVMRVQDWGGDGTVTSNTINITQTGTVDIAGTALTIGGDAFNNVGTEGITWFYSINSGLPVTLYLGESELGGVPVDPATDVGNTFSGVAVSSGDTLQVGFTVNVNGAGDGVEVSSLTVDLIPEPSTSLLAGLAILFLFRRRTR